MAKYAFISPDLSVTEWREIEGDPNVPTHKKHSDGGLFLRPVTENSIPSYRPELAHISTSISVETSRVVITHAVVPLAREQQQQAVKSEARRRILARFPDWKQTNMTARSVELQDIWRRNGLWTVQEQAEADGLAAAWIWIKAVRDTSNTIEAIEQIPDDFDADARWPV